MSFAKFSKPHPDVLLLLTETYEEWRALALARGSNTIKVATDDEDALEALLLALLLSRRQPLDIVFDRRVRISRTP